VRERPGLAERAERNLAKTSMAPAPRAPQGARAAYEEFSAKVLPYPMGNIHPRFWGLVHGQTGPCFGALAEFLAAVMKPQPGAVATTPAILVEAQVISWLKEMLGFPATASGLLVSGGSMANLVGLTVARNTRARCGMCAPWGVAAAPKIDDRLCLGRDPQLQSKGAGIAGGSAARALRRVPVQNDYSIDLTEFAAQ